jgi:hypothetical protein
MYGSDFWTAFAAIAAGVAALVTAATVVFIARQTAATKRSAEASEKTAKAAIDGLVLAGKEQSRAQFLAIEAVKTRIDANMPQILVTPEDLRWPPLLAQSLGDAQPYESPEPFRMPRDKDQRLLVRVDISIKNDGPRTVDVTLTPLLTISGLVKAARLEVGQTLSGTFDAEWSVQQWVEAWKERDATRGGGPLHLFQVMYVNPGDTGAVDHYDVVVQGTVLRPVPTEEGAWALIDFPRVPIGDVGNIAASAQPYTRRYWLSRLRGIELPEIPLDL